MRRKISAIKGAAWGRPQSLRAGFLPWFESLPEVMGEAGYRALPEDVVVTGWLQRGVGATFVRMFVDFRDTPEPP